ncbi:MAG: sulfatase family protein [Solirubrobacterales bacterium]
MTAALRNILLALLTLAALAPATSIAKPPERPNVVMFLTDDQTLAQYNERTMPETTRLLSGTGTTFGEAIVTTPLCCPSRASLISGQYGHNNGVLRNNYDDLRQKGNVLPAWLSRAGYTTIHVGKFMNQYPQSVGSDRKPAPGWDEWHSVVAPRYYDYELQVNGRTERYGSGAADYLGRVIDERSTELVDRYAPRKKPFFLEVDHYAPHISVGDVTGRCENSAVPDPLDFDLFADEPLPMGPSFNEADISDKPSFIQKLPQIEPAAIGGLAELNGCALASLASVDRNVASVYGSVKRAGELGNTVFVFLSDNGFYAGEHRIPVSKQNPYEEAIRVPLVVSAPRKLIGKGSPRKVDLPVANIDVPATILDFAGAEPCTSAKRKDCRTLDGRSLVPLLEGREEKWPEDRALIVELDRGKSPVEADGRACDYTGVRTLEGILIEHRGEIDPAQNGACVPLREYELYNLAADPFQLQSIHSSVTGAAPSALETALTPRLGKLAECRGIRGRDPRPGGGRTWCE